jgi:hypothetical protein
VESELFGDWDLVSVIPDSNYTDSVSSGTGVATAFLNILAKDSNYRWRFSEANEFFIDNRLIGKYKINDDILVITSVEDHGTMDSFKFSLENEKLELINQEDRKGRSKVLLSKIKPID